MKIYPKLIEKFKDQKGIAAVWVAIVLLMLLGFAALAIDVGYLYATKNELQNISDAAALAGTGKLGDLYQSMTHDEQQNFVCGTSCQTSIRDVAKNVVLDGTEKVKAGGSEIFIDDGDIFINEWTGSLFNTNDYNQPDAVRVIARRDASANGPIRMFFARIFEGIGFNFSNINADATAALSGMIEAAPGEVELPVGLSIDRFEGNDWCGDIIKFAPTSDDDACSGWTVFTDHTPTPVPLTNILDGLTGSPRTLVGDTWYTFTGGTIANLFDNMLSAFQRDHIDDMGTPDDSDDYNKAYNVAYLYQPLEGPDTYPIEGTAVYDIPFAYPESSENYDDGFPVSFSIVDGVIQAPVGWSTSECPGCTLQGPVPIALRDNQGDIVYDKDTGLIVQDTYPDEQPRYERRWETTVLVYDSSSCNPNELLRIAGFANVVVYDVHSTPEKTISARIRCDYTKLARGGGGEYGVKGSIPTLVE